MSSLILSIGSLVITPKNKPFYSSILQKKKEDFTLKKFQHGGDIELFAKQLKCKKNDIIDLSSNINFIKPKINIDFNKLDISTYPKYEKLYRIISKEYSVKASKIELFNGGSNAIFTLFKYLDLKDCIIYSPAYLEYKKAAKTFSYNLHKINRFNDINEEIIEKSLIVFVNPSTPDGKYYKLDKLMAYWISKKCTILIDESFLDFTQKQSVIKYLDSYDKLYIIKSMTKFYSSAGIRIGIIISTKQNIKKIKKKEPMWKLSTFDMNYLIKALEDKNFKNKSLSKNDSNRKLLYKILKNQSFIKKVYKSKANFFLIKLRNIAAHELQTKLLKYKIMIRDCSNFDFLDDTYVRIAVKNEKSIQILKKVFKKIEKNVY